MDCLQFEIYFACSATEAATLTCNFNWKKNYTQAAVGMKVGFDALNSQQAVSLTVSIMLLASALVSGCIRD